MNVGIFAGRVGKDAVVRQTKAGESVLGFSVAVDVYVGGGEKETLWVDCSMWGERGAKVAEYVTKGASVTVQGRISLDSYEGQPKLRLNVQELTLQGGKREEGQRQDEKPKAEHKPQGYSGTGGGGGRSRSAPMAPTRGNDPFPDDDIPFIRCDGAA